MLTQVAIVLLTQASLLGQAGQVDIRPSPPEIQQAIRELGDSRFSVRMKASELLWKAGRAAEGALRLAAKSDDREAAFRAKEVLRKFEYGIYPDTPTDLAAIILRFRDGDEKGKRVALEQLRSKGHIRTLLKLLQTDLPEELRNTLTQQYLRDVEKIVPTLIVQGDTKKAEELLELAAIEPTAMRHFATYLLLTGKLEEKIEQVRASIAAAPDATQQRFLVYLLRAKGDLGGALEPARAVDLDQEILYEMGDWRALARLSEIPKFPDAPMPAGDAPKPKDDEKKADEGSPITSQDIEQLGFLAASIRLSGDEARFAKAIGALKAAGKLSLLHEEEDVAWYCVEALFANRQLDDAIQLLGEFRPGSAFQLLCEQHRYREALKLIELEDFSTVEAWFKETVAKIGTESDKRNRLVPLAVEVARLLHRVGLKDQAKQGFSLLAAKLDNEKNASQLGVVAQAEYRLGMRDEAFEHAANVISRHNRPYFLRSLFPDDYTLAQMCWTYFRANHAAESGAQTLKKIHRLFYPSIYDEPLDEPLQWVKDIESGVKAVAVELQGQQFYFLAEVCRDLDGDYADELLRNAADKKHAEASMQLGDLSAEKEKWQEAAEHYHTAWKNDTNYPRNTVGLYLSGHALKKAEKNVSEGQRRIDLARLLPFAGLMRRELGGALRDHDLRDEALAEFELLARTGEPGSYDASHAHQQIGNLINKEKPALAADHWEKLLLSILKTSSAFIQPEGYLKLPHLIHKSHARGFIAAGDQTAAEREIWLSLAALPGDVEFGEDLTKDLREAGWNDLANQVYDKVAKRLDVVLNDYPRSPLHLNNAAWLAALNDKDLDKALRRANLAVELVPKNAAYIDTLAEVHFRRGDRKLALKLARECLEMKPKDEHFQKQVKRFQPSP